MVECGALAPCIETKRSNPQPDWEIASTPRFRHLHLRQVQVYGREVRSPYSTSGVSQHLHRTPTPLRFGDFVRLVQCRCDTCLVCILEVFDHQVGNIGRGVFAQNAEEIRAGGALAQVLSIVIPENSMPSLKSPCTAVSVL